MKKSISLILLLVVGFTLPVMFAPNAKVLVRALHQSDEFNLQTIMMPSWLADLRLKTLGINDCVLSFTDKDDTGSVINFLVNAYGGEGVNNARLESYISRFVQQGCSINEYDLAGMTPLHGAVLFAHPNLIKLLLKNNADVTKKINRPGKRVDGMQPLKFAKFLLVSNQSQALKDIILILQDNKQ